MNFTPHFTLDEFIHSDTALHAGIDNTPPPELIAELVESAWMMEKIRAMLHFACGKEVPIVILSGYRCLPLNRAIGSKDTSDHIKGAAVDFRAPAFGTPLAICKLLEHHMGDFGIGQMIYERTWVHVSRNSPSKPINRIITARTASEFLPGLVEV